MTSNLPPIDEVTVLVKECLNLVDKENIVCEQKGVVYFEVKKEHYKASLLNIRMNYEMHYKRKLYPMKFNKNHIDKTDKKV